MNAAVVRHNGEAARAKLRKAMSPDHIHVDERSLADRLNFAARYGELINYYDQDNQRAGDWSQFYLKDPIILMAKISKTEYEHKYESYHSWYQRTKHEIKNTKQTKSTRTDSHPHKIVREGLNQLCLLLHAIFKDMNEWVVSMELSTRRYHVKDYVLHRISDDIGQALWQFVVLWQAIATNWNIPAPDFPLFRSFATPWQHEGKTNGNYLPKARKSDHSHKGSQKERDKKSYKGSSGKDKRGTSDHLDKVLKEYRQIFDLVFPFYVQVIDSAEEELNKLLLKSGEFPDTALLIAFLQLLENQQAQLNELTGKHLDFYYRKILKQKPKNYIPDEVFLCCHLKTGVDDFLLPAGQEFLAGTYPDKTPILFASSEATNLNQIKISQAMTTWYGATANSDSMVLCLQQDPKPNQVKKNAVRANRNMGFAGISLSDDSATWLRFRVAGTVFRSCNGRAGFDTGV